MQTGVSLDGTDDGVLMHDAWTLFWRIKILPNIPVGYHESLQQWDVVFVEQKVLNGEHVVNSLLDQRRERHRLDVLHWIGLITEIIVPTVDRLNIPGPIDKDFCF